MDARGSAGPAQRIADHPAHRIAGSNRSGTDELFAFLQCDIGHLARLGIDLKQRALGIGIALDRIVESDIVGLDPCGIVRRSHLALGVRGGARARGAARGSGGGLPRTEKVRNSDVVLQGRESPCERAQCVD